MGMVTVGNKGDLIMKKKLEAAMPKYKLKPKIGKINPKNKNNVKFKE
jgi:hypothetical protein